MKKTLLFVGLLLSTVRLLSQTGAPARLALVSESALTIPAVDLLTAPLSALPRVHLLERNELERVYREQALSRTNTDYLKLGRILGADGLLLLNIAPEGAGLAMEVRLIAVRPGVVVLVDRFSWPVTDLVPWSEAFARRLSPLIPKLLVPAKEAIPISVVNLRSATAAAGAPELERELRTLAIQRLSREPRFFVLERQRMDLLTGEKELQGDDQAFWNGAYLFEAIVDQEGFSRGLVSLDARLTPRNGGLLLQFRAAGARTNLAEVVNRLAAKVASALSVAAPVGEWNADGEAARYFEEAQWALRWGDYNEARISAESAWALGKQDQACVTARIRAYAIPLKTIPCAERLGIDPSIAFSQEPTGREYMRRFALQAKAVHSTTLWHTNKNGILLAAFDELPAEEDLDRASRALEIYVEFSRRLSGAPATPDRGPATGRTRDPEWDGTGDEALAAASRVLFSFALMPKSQRQAAEKLAGLKALARSAAGLLSRRSTDPLKDWRMSFWRFVWQDQPLDEAGLYYVLSASDPSLFEAAPPPPVYQSRDSNGPRPFPHPNNPLFLDRVARAAGAAPKSLVQTARPAPRPAPNLVAPATVDESPPENPANIIRIAALGSFPYGRIQGRIQGGIQSRASPQPTVFAQRWTGGKFVSAFHYNKQDVVFVGGVEMPNGPSERLMGVAIFDPAKGAWDLISDIRPPNPTSLYVLDFPQFSLNECFTFFHGKLYCSLFETLEVFDFATRSWQAVSIPLAGESSLFPVGDRLFAADANSLFDITDAPQAGRLLASTRRRPALSVLDSLEGFRSPLVFTAWNGSLALSLQRKVYLQNAEAWSAAVLPPLSRPPEVFEESVLLRAVPSKSSEAPASLWMWRKGRASPESFLHAPPAPPLEAANARRAAAASILRPRWRTPSDYRISSRAALHGSRLYFLDETAGLSYVSNQWVVVTRRGFHANLVCLDPDLDEPLMVPLKFDARQGRPPLKLIGDKLKPMQAANPVSSLLLETVAHFSAGTLYFTESEVPGVWATPLAPLEAAFALRKQAVLERMAGEEAEERPRRAAILARHDSNHNGVIDPEEKEGALGDPSFIEFQLDVIDADRDGCLDAREISYFDANNNGVLEPSEAAGIATTQHLLAGKLFKELDRNGDGFIDDHEAWASSPETSGPAVINFGQDFHLLDLNHDGRVDPGEFEAFLNRRLLDALRSGGRTASAPGGRSAVSSEPADPTSGTFKAAVESYWRASTGSGGRIGP